MKKRSVIGLIIFTGAFLMLSGLNACTRKVASEEDQKPFVRLIEHQSIQSRILDRALHYAVLLPKEYEHSDTRFPVVYLLHGFGESETGWYQGGVVQYYIDLYASETVPMIYVMPEGFNSYWVNKYNGHFAYMDMFVKELVPAIDSIYRTIKDPAHRAVMGYSMGGYGAMILPVKNHNVFKTGVVLSMSFRTDEQYLAEPQSVFDYQWASVFGGTGATGEQRLTGYFKSFSPFHFLGAPGDTSMNGVNLFIDCGDDEESLSITNDAFHDTLRSLGISHEYRVRNGAHTWSYWHSALPEALKYIGYAVRGIPYPADADPVDPGLAVPDDRLINEHRPESGISYTVELPVSYAGSMASYPVILILHDRTAGSGSTESKRLFSLMNTLMSGSKLPESLVVEVPLQESPLTSGALQDILDQVRSKYRTYPDKQHTIIIGNSVGGEKALECIPGIASYINGCFLFDAVIPGNASPANPGIFYYLDICDNGLNYGSYHAFYLMLREDSIDHEYRVRRGLPTHDAFLSGLSEASGYMTDHLISQ